MESKIEKAKQVFRKMLVDEYGIKSVDQFFSTEGEAMAEIYESMKIEQENFNRISLCLEITESLFIEDIDYILPLLQKVHEMGLHISMDDFGTGYSSLSYLKLLPLDQFKIDKSFVSDLVESNRSRAIIGGIIHIAKTMNLQVVAEGVETLAQRDALIDLGCAAGQGFLWGKPAPSIAAQVG